MTTVQVHPDEQTVPRQRRGTPEAGRPSFRKDIQALRAVAVLLVVLYHAHVPGISGGYVGVDVFFVISGFLISGQLLRQAERDGRISFGRFYARRIRRLLPPAVLVIVVTLVIARLVMPPLQTRDLVTHALFSLVYAVNYRLAAEGVDYQQLSASASALQHYWSLAVEEQFYLIWPLLIGLTFLVARRYGRRALAGVLGLLFAVSLFESVAVTQHDSSLAYFALQTRAWEFAAGALVAVFAERLRHLNARLAQVGVGVGLAAIVASGLIYTDGTAFPGTAALLPVAGAALVIAAGCGTRTGKVLSWRPLQGIGQVSYGWYLWHWTAVILLPMMFDEPFGWIRNLEASLLALWLAVLTYFCVEHPSQLSRLRSWHWGAVGLIESLVAAAVCLLMAASLPTLTGTGRELHVVGAQTAAGREYLIKARNAIQGSTLIQNVPRNLTPDLSNAAHDYPETSFTQDCHANFLDVVQGPCVFGDPNGTRTVALFGDSHMEQWEPAFAEAAKREHWRVVSWTKSACPLIDRLIRNDQLNRVYTECQTWFRSTVGRLIVLAPDLVVVSQSDSVPGKALTDQIYADETVATLTRLRQADIKVAYLLDIVRPSADVPVCISAHLTNAVACATPNAGDWTAPRRAVLRNALAEHDIPAFDPRPWQCTATICPALVGNLLVYRDASHFTATYSRWLAPMVQPLLR